MTIVLWIAGVTLALVGLTVAAWAMFGDRSRARRCRGCWYEMEGVPGLRCPECGRKAKDEAVLTRRRRRWRLSGVGVLIVSIGSGLVHYGTAQRPNGWWSIAPNFMLVWAYSRTHLIDPAKELCERDVTTMSSEVKRAMIMGAIRRWRRTVVPNDAGLYRCDSDSKTNLLTVYDYKVLHAPMRTDPELCVDCAHELLLSTDPRDQAAALGFLACIGNEWNERREHAFMARLSLEDHARGGVTAVSRMSMVGPPYLARSTFDEDTIGHVARAVLDHTTAYSAIESLEFFADIEPFDPALFEKITVAAMDEARHTGAIEASALLMGRGREGRDALADILSCPDVVRRYYALLALGELERDAVEHLPLIEALRDDPDPRIAGAARWAANRVDAEPIDWMLSPSPWTSKPDEVSEGPVTEDDR
jgi:hypothetical protein